jgi:hypothetical protein
VPLFFGGFSFMNTRKSLGLAATLGVVLTITTCHALSEPAVAESEEMTQSLDVPSAFSFVEHVPVAPSFERIEVEVVEVAPWLKPEYQSIVLSDDELLSILRKAGFSGHGLKMAWAVVQKESSARPYAHNDNRNTGDNSYGLFQINMIDSLGPARLKKYGLGGNEDLFHPETNARVAYQISSGGSSWGAWTTRKAAESVLHKFPG